MRRIICPHGLARFSCRPCTRESRNAWRQRNRDRMCAYSRKWRASNRATRNATDRAKRHGLEPHQVEALVRAQGGRCAICSRVYGSALVVDHCHETGAVRGMLCHQCNRGLGQLRDSLELVRAAADYLERARAARAVVT